MPPVSVRDDAAAVVALCSSSECASSAVSGSEAWQTRVLLARAARARLHEWTHRRHRRTRSREPNQDEDEQEEDACEEVWQQLTRRVRAAARCAVESGPSVEHLSRTLCAALTADAAATTTIDVASDENSTTADDPPVTLARVERGLLRVIRCCLEDADPCLASSSVAAAASSRFTSRTARLDARDRARRLAGSFARLAESAVPALAQALTHASRTALLYLLLSTSLATPPPPGNRTNASDDTRRSITPAGAGPASVDTLHSDGSSTAPPTHSAPVVELCSRLLLTILRANEGNDVSSTTTAVDMSRVLLTQWQSLRSSPSHYDSTASRLSEQLAWSARREDQLKSDLLNFLLPRIASPPAVAAAHDDEDPSAQSAHLPMMLAAQMLRIGDVVELAPLLVEASRTVTHACLLSRRRRTICDIFSGLSESLESTRRRDHEEKDDQVSQLRRALQPCHESVTISLRSLGLLRERAAFFTSVTELASGMLAASTTTEDAPLGPAFLFGEATTSSSTTPHLVFDVHLLLSHFIARAGSRESVLDACDVTLVTTIGDMVRVAALSSTGDIEDLLSFGHALPSTTRSLTDSASDLESTLLAVWSALISHAVGVALINATDGVLEKEEEEAHLHTSVLARFQWVVQTRVFVADTLQRLQASRDSRGLASDKVASRWLANLLEAARLAPRIRSSLLARLCRIAADEGATDADTIDSDDATDFFTLASWHALLRESDAKPRASHSARATTMLASRIRLASTSLERLIADQADYRKTTAAAAAAVAHRPSEVADSSSFTPAFLRTLLRTIDAAHEVEVISADAVRRSTSDSTATETRSLTPVVRMMSPRAPQSARASSNTPSSSPRATIVLLASPSVADSAPVHSPAVRRKPKSSPAPSPQNQPQPLGTPTSTRAPPTPLPSPPPAVPTPTPTITDRLLALPTPPAVLDVDEDAPLPDQTWALREDATLLATRAHALLVTLLNDALKRPTHSAAATTVKHLRTIVATTTTGDVDAASHPSEDDVRACLARFGAYVTRARHVRTARTAFESLCAVWRLFTPSPRPLTVPSIAPSHGANSADSAASLLPTVLRLHSHLVRVYVRMSVVDGGAVTPRFFFASYCTRIARLLEDLLTRPRTSECNYEATTNTTADRFSSSPPSACCWSDDDIGAFAFAHLAHSYSLTSPLPAAVHFESRRCLEGASVTSLLRRPVGCLSLFTRSATASAPSPLEDKTFADTIAAVSRTGMRCEDDHDDVGGGFDALSCSTSSLSSERARLVSQLLWTSLAHSSVADTLVRVEFLLGALGDLYASEEHERAHATIQGIDRTVAGQTFEHVAHTLVLAMVHASVAATAIATTQELVAHLPALWRVSHEFGELSRRAQHVAADGAVKALVELSGASRRCRDLVQARVDEANLLARSRDPDDDHNPNAENDENQMAFLHLPKAPLSVAVWPTRAASTRISASSSSAGGGLSPLRPTPIESVYRPLERIAPSAFQCMQQRRADAAVVPSSTPVGGTAGLVSPGSLPSESRVRPGSVSRLFSSHRRRTSTADDDDPAASNSKPTTPASVSASVSVAHSRARAHAVSSSSSSKDRIKKQLQFGGPHTDESETATIATTAATTIAQATTVPSSNVPTRTNPKAAHGRSGGSGGTRRGVASIVPVGEPTIDEPHKKRAKRANVAPLPQSVALSTPHRTIVALEPLVIDDDVPMSGDEA